uniref:Zf-CCHC domain-containing protein/UBN2 domain-containing protein n=1 Tax=Tanacetum cinerariifolium TaxID=118510 RepID=A0A6L2L1T1_TANCI|nr:zf-CCHC domain-containing protein/UBN2 domain-containing protein [Tanacetum cinerariifolium]
MAQENYVEGCSMQRLPLLEAVGFCFWKIHFETYVKSKDTDLWRAKVMAIEEAKDLATLPLDELIDNLKVYEMVLEGDGVVSKTIKEKVPKAQDKKRDYYNCEEEGHFIGECPKPKENKAFVGGAWSDSEDNDEPLKDAICLMEINSQEIQHKPFISNNDLNIHDLQKENKELLKFNKYSTINF